MKMKCKAIIFSIVVFFNASCDDGEIIVLSGVNEKKAEEVKILIEAELRVGSTSDEIEHFFNEHHIVFSYDRFSERYQGIIRDVSDDDEVDQAITIYIYLDKEKLFKLLEVEDSFTAI